VLAGDVAPRSLELEHARWRAPDDLARRFAQAVAEGVPHLTLELVAR